MLFDVKSQEWEYYRRILNAPNLVVPEYGVRGEIIQVTAEQYIREIAQLTNSAYESHMRILTTQSADRKVIERLKKVDTPIAIPVINYTCRAQEGRHRAVAFAELHGDDATFPCLVVYWIDEKAKGLSYWKWLQTMRCKPKTENKERS